MNRSRRQFGLAFVFITVATLCFSQAASAQIASGGPTARLDWIDTGELFSGLSSNKPAIEKALQRALNRQARMSSACLKRMTGATDALPQSWWVKIDAEPREFTSAGSSNTWWLAQLTVNGTFDGRRFQVTAPASQILYDFDDFPPQDATDFLSDLLLLVGEQFSECERNYSGAGDPDLDKALNLIRDSIESSNQAAVEGVAARFEERFAADGDRQLVLSDEGLIDALEWCKTLGGWYTKLALWDTETAPLESGAMAEKALVHLQLAQLASQNLEDRMASTPDLELPEIYRLNREISANLVRINAPTVSTLRQVLPEWMRPEPDAYIGDRVRIAVGYDSETDLTGEFFWDLLKDKDYDNDKAVSFEGWKGSDSAGGLKINLHWLGGDKNNGVQTDRQGRKYYQDGTVRKLFLAADWNIYSDGKLTFGGGGEHKDQFWSAYASKSITGERLLSSDQSIEQVTTSGTTADFHPWTRTDSTITTTDYLAHPYNWGLGFRFGKYIDSHLLRIRGGLDYEFGDFDSSQISASVNLEKRFLGSSQGVSLRLEVLRKQGDFETDQSDVRFSLFWSYDFGRIFRHLESVPENCDVSYYVDSERAWIRRALRNAAGYKRTVDYYRYEKATEQTETVYEVSNQGPKANDDFYEFEANSSDNKMPVLSNDQDPEQDELEIIAFTQPAHGTVEQQGNLLFYTPVTGFSGRDTFVYTIEDRHLTTPHPPGEPSQAAVLILVNAGTVIAVDDLYTVHKNSRSNPLNVLENDSDPEGEAFGIIEVSKPAWGITEFSSTLVFFTPKPGSCEADLFEYEIEDSSGARDTATVSVTVLNQAPSAEDDRDTTCIDTAVVINVLANDSDPDGDPVVISRIDATSWSGATITNNGDGTVTYMPPPGWAGRDTFEYTIVDDCGESSSARVTVDVTLD